MHAHDSDSAAQRGAERLILDEVERVVGRSLSPTRLSLAGGARVDVDGVADDQSVLVEVFAHQGALKGGQRHKIATDVLKLLTIAREREPRPRMLLAFAEPKLAEWAAGGSWLAASIAAWGVEVIVVELDDSVRSELVAAQARQIMVNPVAPASQPE